MSEPMQRNSIHTAAEPSQAAASTPARSPPPSPTVAKAHGDHDDILAEASMLLKEQSPKATSATAAAMTRDDGKARGGGTAQKEAGVHRIAASIRNRTSTTVTSTTSSPNRPTDTEFSPMPRRALPPNAPAHELLAPFLTDATMASSVDNTSTPSSSREGSHAMKGSGGARGSSSTTTTTATYVRLTPIQMRKLLTTAAATQNNKNPQEARADTTCSARDTSEEEKLMARIVRLREILKEKESTAHAIVQAREAQGKKLTPSLAEATAEKDLSQEELSAMLQLYKELGSFLLQKDTQHTVDAEGTTTTAALPATTPRIPTTAEEIAALTGVSPSLPHQPFENPASGGSRTTNANSSASGPHEAHPYSSPLPPTGSFLKDVAVPVGTPPATSTGAAAVQAGEPRNTPAAKARFGPPASFPRGQDAPLLPGELRFVPQPPPAASNTRVSQQPLHDELVSGGSFASISHSGTDGAGGKVKMVSFTPSMAPEEKSDKEANAAGAGNAAAEETSGRASHTRASSVTGKELAGTSTTTNGSTVLPVPISVHNNETNPIGVGKRNEDSSVSSPKGTAAPVVNAAVSSSSHIASSIFSSEGEAESHQPLLRPEKEGKEEGEGTSKKGPSVSPSRKSSSFGYSSDTGEHDSHATGGESDATAAAAAAIGEGEDDEEDSLEGELDELRFERALGEVDNIMADAEIAYARVQRFATNLLMLMRSWVHLANGDRFESFATDIFSLMLREHPEYSLLFATTDIKQVSKTILGMVGKAVVAFAKPDDMLDLMHEMGARHCLYGVSETNYVALREAFYQVYPQYVSQEMYDESIEAWYLLWKTVVELMVNGGHSKRAKFYERKRRERWIARLQEGYKVLEPLQRADADDARKHLFIPYMYDVALAAEPAIAMFARLRDVGPSDRAFEGIGRIIRHLREEKKVKRYCSELASRHVSYGMTPAYFRLAGGPFCAAVEHFLKDDPSYNPLMAHAFREFWDYLVELWTPELKVNTLAELGNSNAPDGSTHFCILFTDIEASTNLWESEPHSMQAAVQAHHTVIRGLIDDYGGYEVKTVGDSFMIATKDALIALKIALAIQLEMMRSPIAAGFSMSAAVPDPQGAGDPACWRDDSLRVRVGIHYCTDASAVYDSVHRRFDYYGPGVNLAARVEAAACGGQILMTQEAVDALKETGFHTEPHPQLLNGVGVGLLPEELIGVGPLDSAGEGRPSMRSHSDLSVNSRKSVVSTSTTTTTTTSRRDHAFLMKPLADFTEFRDLGLTELKGIAEPKHLVSVLPSALAGRTFANSTGSTSAAAAAAAAAGEEEDPSSGGNGDR